MRRVLTVIIFLSILRVSANAEEILFRDLPWLSSIDEVFSELGIFDAETTEKTAENWEWLFDSRNNQINGFGTYVFDDWGTYDDAGFCFRPYMTCPFEDVAGYNLTYVELQFMYGVENDKVFRDKEHAQFISGKYTLRPDDYQSAYDDLRDKLIWLYGNPLREESEKFGWDNKGRKYYSLWEGDNGASLLLYVKYRTDDSSLRSCDLTIEYAKTDAVGQLEYLQEYYEARQRDEKYNSDNTSGL
ncbi:MAG: hypothetical protein IJ074_02335 [Clostridia bacterium]|nr:hypothetical protein [Clostridia bacterium]